MASNPVGVPRLLIKVAGRFRLHRSHLNKTIVPFVSIAERTGGPYGTVGLRGLCYKQVTEFRSCPFTLTLHTDGDYESGELTFCEMYKQVATMKLQVFLLWMIQPANPCRVGVKTN